MSDNLKFDDSTNTLTVTDVDGIDYRIGGKVIEGDVKLTKDTVVTARPQPGYTFSKGAQTQFEFEVNQELVEQERSDAIQAARNDSADGDSDSAKPARPVQTRSSGSGDVAPGAGTTPSPGTSASTGQAGSTNP